MPKHNFDAYTLSLLIKQREKLNLTRAQLDERLGLSQRMVSKWERGDRQPTAANLERWARALGMQVILRKSQ